VYQSGNGWLILDQSTNINWGSVRVFPKPQGLAAGTYTANVVINAGPQFGSQSVPVTLTVRPAPVVPAPQPPSQPAPTPAPEPAPPAPAPAAPAAPTPAVSSILNAASLLPAPMVPGSLATLKGSNFAGKSVSVGFDGIAAKVFYSDASQINLLVPSELRGRDSAMMTVKVDDVSSAPQFVSLASLWPAIFANGVLNQNNAVAPAAPGSVIQIFATGLPSGTRSITAQVHDRANLVPQFAGDAPGIPGLQQVNVVVPDDLPAMQTFVSVCGYGPDGKQLCSQGAPLAIASK
jgi:uncharacterized protein (TIGR03437 family)